MIPMPELKSLKKGQSGRSGLLGARSNAIDSGRDTRHFPIEKKHRFANRFFQAVCAFASYYFLGKQDHALITSHQLWNVMNLNWFVSICGPIVAAAMIGQYFVTVIITNWNSRKILALELLMDVSFSVLFMVCFIAEIVQMGSVNILFALPLYSNKQQMANIISIILSFIFWIVAAGFDVHSILVGFGILGNWGDRIEDLEMDASIRRMGRQ
ncbi:hypothetical protein HK101_011269 [Irineochytrium annulatum]|nr:hypothetical protein HK101_011269 [Irineochytrium annulatum]